MCLTIAGDLSIQAEIPRTLSKYHVIDTRLTSLFWREDASGHMKDINVRNLGYKVETKRAVTQYKLCGTNQHAVCAFSVPHAPQIRRPERPIMGAGGAVAE